ncbi:MAG: hypothetical protein LW809_03335 [Vampirovibrionales bacterium]|jgi:hypothetical protein|nr:hypothetical protein [Vampirovibrionales bacterium]
MKNYISLAIIGVCLIVPQAQAYEYVNGYTRYDGTYVAPYVRTSPDSSTLNNFGSPSNINHYYRNTNTVLPIQLNDNKPTMLERYERMNNMSESLKYGIPR